MTGGAHLLALVGLAPAVASETYWAMLRRGEDVSAITLVTTNRGAMKARQSLLGDNGALASIAAVFAKQQPPRTHLHLLSGADAPVEDIVSSDDQLAVQIALDGLVRRFTEGDAPPLHASLAGGRKTMAAALALAMSFHARAQDRLSHVLVGMPYAADPDFLFPPRDDPVAADSITLVDTPFVRLRPLLPARLRERPLSELTAAAHHLVDAAAPALLDLDARTLGCGKRIIALPPIQAAMLAVLANKPEGVCALELPMKLVAQAYLAAGATRGAADELSHRLAEDGADAWLRETISRIQTRLRADLPLEWSTRLAILRVGRRPRTHYVLAPRAVLVCKTVAEMREDN
jgi:CRISPR-associated protein (TIGR02584 family)